MTDSSGQASTCLTSPAKHQDLGESASVVVAVAPVKKAVKEEEMDAGMDEMPDDPDTRALR